VVPAVAPIWRHSNSSTGERGKEIQKFMTVPAVVTTLGTKTLLVSCVLLTPYPYQISTSAKAVLHSTNSLTWCKSMLVNARIQQLPDHPVMCRTRVPM
jgi:hypothetical protein